MHRHQSGGRSGPQQRHAVAAAGDEQRLGAERLQELASGFLQRAGVVADAPPDGLLQLDLVGLRHGDAAVPRDSGARVDAHGAALRREGTDGVHHRGRKETKPVVGDEDRVALPGRLGERLDELLRQRCSGRAGAVPVDAEHLLAAGVLPAREDASLGGGRAVDGEDRGIVGAAVAQQRPQPPADLVVADQSDGLHARPQGAEVHDGVGRAAGLQLGGLVADDQHRRFATDAVGLAVDELVGDQIADRCDSRAGKPFQKLREVRVHAALPLTLHPLVPLRGASSSGGGPRTSGPDGAGSLLPPRG